MDPQRIAHYEIQARLGAGGMGEVWKAWDPKLQRTVAIKVLTPSPDSGLQSLAPDPAERILREVRTASALNHPNICTRHDVGEADPSAGSGQAVSFIVMEHVEGKPLSELIPSDGLPAETVVRYGTQIADALAHAHEHGIVHRDRKSANVVITPDGRAKVLDFGVADTLPDQDAEAVTRTQAALSDAGMLVGTLAYMAPEVLRGEPATSRSDIWALGVLLYEMASGRVPFEAPVVTEVIAGIVRDTPATLPARVTPGLRPVVQRALAKESGRRYSGGGDVRAALDELNARSRIEEVPSGLRAALTARLGRIDEALGLLDRAYEARDPWLTHSKVSPEFEYLRGHPRLNVVLARLRLPQ